MFLERRRLAYEKADGRALKQLEAPVNLDWRETSHRRFSIYVYVPTYAQLRDASEVAALSVTQMVQAILMIAVAETEGWGRHLGPELEEFIRHLNRRLLVLEGGGLRCSSTPEYRCTAVPVTFCAHVPVVLCVSVLVMYWEPCN